ncbi:hypothetical protein B0H13DRAFT_2681160 [Mycena leptocephala]|nr:hypothetical protein B0H13DRAFT_2681160 [Mycena leptocephala]
MYALGSRLPAPLDIGRSAILHAPYAYGGTKADGIAAARFVEEAAIRLRYRSCASHQARHAPALTTMMLTRTCPPALQALRALNVHIVLGVD